MRHALALLAAPLVMSAGFACSQPRMDHASKAATPEASTAGARYVALGDSFTIGTGGTPDRSFPARVTSRWGACVSLDNLGVNGFTTQDLIDLELPELARSSPTFVSLAIGANDIVRGRTANDYRARVRRILAAIVAAGVAAKQVVAVPQPDWSLSPAAAGFGDRASLASAIEAFNGILREEAEGIGAAYVDIFPLMRKEAQGAMLAGDGLHPSAAAYDEWAAAIVAAIPSPCQSR